jgi:hypothetical protein
LSYLPPSVIASRRAEAILASFPVHASETEVFSNTVNIFEASDVPRQCSRSGERLGQKAGAFTELLGVIPRQEMKQVISHQAKTGCW